MEVTGVGLVVGLPEWRLAVAADKERGGWHLLLLVDFLDLVEPIEQPCCSDFRGLRVGTQRREHGAELVIRGLLDAGVDVGHVGGWSIGIQGLLLKFGVLYDQRSTGFKITGELYLLF